MEEDFIISLLRSDTEIAEPVEKPGNIYMIQEKDPYYIKLAKVYAGRSDLKYIRNVTKPLLEALANPIKGEEENKLQEIKYYMSPLELSEKPFDYVDLLARAAYKLNITPSSLEQKASLTNVFRYRDLPELNNDELVYITLLSTLLNDNPLQWIRDLRQPKMRDVLKKYDRRLR